MLIAMTSAGMSWFYFWDIVAMCVVGSLVLVGVPDDRARGVAVPTAG